MARLEDLQAGALVRGLSGDGPVTVKMVQWFGDYGVEVIFADAGGTLGQRLVYRDDEPILKIVAGGRPWSFDGDGELLRLVSEAHRIELAWLFDPYVAITTSLIEPLPHQISAVYEEMLPRQPMRFLLTDDPGAGKTIMAGLLIKELMLRGLEEHRLSAPSVPTTEDKRRASATAALDAPHKDDEGACQSAPTWSAAAKTGWRSRARATPAVSPELKRRARVSGASQLFMHAMGE